MLSGQSLINRKLNNNGFSVVEIILSIAVFALAATAIVGAISYAQLSTAQSSLRLQAISLAEEGVEGVRNIRDNEFSNLIDGAYGLSAVSNEWALTQSPDTTGIYTRTITIESTDANTKKITSTVSWNYLGRASSVSISGNLTSWKKRGLAPSKPSSLALAATSTSQINLTWTASTDRNGLGVSGYKVERAPDSSGVAGSFSQLNTSATANYSDTTGSANTKYWYIVRAYDSLFNSSYTGEMENDSSTIALWHFNEGTGQTTDNSASLSSNAKLGSIVLPDSSDPTWTTSGKNAYALSFDGSNDYAKVTDNNSIDFGTGDFNIEAWVKTSSATNQTIISKRNSDAGSTGYMFRISADGTLLLTLTDQAAHQVDTTSTGYSLLDNNWHYVSAVINRATNIVTFYVDGVAKTTNSSNISSITSSLTNVIDLRIGFTPDNLQPFNGVIDEIRLSNYARTSSEISAYYTEGNTNPKSKITLPNVPVSPAASAASVSQIDINWSSGGAQDHYHVKSSANGYATDIYNSTATSTSQSSLTAGTQYTYRIYGVNADDAQSSSYASISKYTLSNPPTLPVATDGTYTNKINVSWTASLTASSYKVYRDGISGTGTLVYNSTGTNFDDTITGTHTYYIYSVNGDGVENTSYISDSGFTSTPPSWATPAIDTSLDVNHPGGTATTNAYDAISIQIDGNYAYIIKNDGASVTYNDFFIVDISSAAPSVIGYTRVFSGATALTLTNLSKAVMSGATKYVYVTTNNGSFEFARINVTNPAAPTATPFNISAGSYTVNKGVYAIAGSPPTIFVTAGSASASNLFAINGDTGATIKSRALTAAASQTAEEIVIIGNRAYVSSDHDTAELQTIGNADGTATAMTSIGNYNILTDASAASAANALSIDGYNSGSTNTVLLGLTDGRLIKVNQNTSTNALSLGGSYNSAVVSNFNDVSINSANTLAFIATSNTAAEFRAITISSMTSYGFHNISGVTAICRGVAYHNSKDKAYMATQEDTKELYIVKPN